MNETRASFFATKKKIWIPICAVLAAAILAFASFATYALTYSKSFPNIYLEDVAVSGMTKEQVVATIDDLGAHKYTNANFTITAADIITKISAQELGVRLDTTGMANAVMAVGREGGFWQKLSTVWSCVFGKHELDVSVSLDPAMLDAVVEEVAKANVSPTDASFDVEEDVLILQPPVDGKKVNEVALRERLTQKFADRDYGDMILDLETWAAQPLDLDKVYAEVHKEAKDAVIETVNGKKVLTPHVVGVNFDLAAAKKALAATPDKKIEIKLTLTQPKVTTLQLQASNELFYQTLSSVTTHFSSKKVNRVSNVKLAARLVNGTVLNPGEVFSYNRVVGPRTTARGFKEAAIFASGEVVDGVGGGICQVSSTLYMASMYADLKTIQRTNHSFYVDYAPKGQDATVVYGSIDFQFQNDTDAPIKIYASATSTSVTITIKGTRAEKRTVKITTSTTGTTPFPTQTVVDRTLKPGEKVVKQKGQNGIKMEVYRKVYDAKGNLIRQEHENTTKYKPMPQIISVGASAASAEVTTPQTPTEGQTPVEEQKPTTPPTPAPVQVPEETPAPAEPAVTPAPEPDEAPAEQPSEPPETTES